MRRPNRQQTKKNDAAECELELVGEMAAQIHSNGFSGEQFLVTPNPIVHKWGEGELVHLLARQP